MLTAPVKVGDRVREVNAGSWRCGTVVRVTESNVSIAYVVWDWDERWDVRRQDDAEIVTLSRESE